MAAKLNSKQDRNKESTGNTMHLSKTAKFGKLVRVELESTDKKIRKIQITGDFFLHPEEKIEELESLLVGANLEDRQEIQRKIQKALQGCDFYGFELDSLVELVHSFSKEWEKSQ